MSRALKDRGELRLGEGPQLDLSWVDREGCACLEIRGWSEADLAALGELSSRGLGQRLSVLPVELVGTADAFQPIVGQFRIEQPVIRFTPRFPFVDGQSYALLVSDGAARAVASTIARVARPAQATTKVVAIYPTADVVPLNLLKLYIQFSAPMSEGRATVAIHVRRVDDGTALEDVFLKMEPELWDPTRQRLTMLLDPGRIKRGLAPHEEAGYPLTEGMPIVVSVDTALRDAAGQPLAATLEQRYNVGPAERTRVDPTTWRYESPQAATINGLTVSFGRPLDHALLQHSLKVVDGSGGPVLGQAYPGPGEWCWWFEPESPWQPGRYALTVDARLEDLAGNSVARVFDRDLMRDEDTPPPAKRAAIEFEVR